MNPCIIYLASPRDWPIHPKTNLTRRYEALKYSLVSVRMMIPNLPIYVFHEDYTEEDKNALRIAVTEFFQVDFSGFEDVYRPINAPKGYTMMCRFFSGVVQQHPALQQHTHYIRFDDDSYLISPFLTESRILSYGNVDYVLRSVFHESKPQQTLFDFTIRFLKKLGMNEVDYLMLRGSLQREKFLKGNVYTGKAPYNNFHVASLRLWKHPIVSRYIQAIEDVHGCLAHGWLDANIHAMIIWVLAKRYRDIVVQADMSFGYRHNIHVSLIDSLNVIADERLHFIPCDEEDTRPTHLLNLTIPGKLCFVTFANTGYMSTERIQTQAREFGVFDAIKGYTEQDIPDFIERHADFIKSSKHGYGKWIWKPKILVDALSKLEDGDILVYCDAGMYLNRHGLKRFGEYVDMLQTHSLVVFNLNGDYTADKFACPELVQTYFPDFHNQIYRYCYAGVFMIKKTAESVTLIQEWLSFCENYNFLNFCDADNGIFNVCLAKHDSIVKKIYPDETNVYFSDGSQFYGCPIWDSLKDFPFQCRRLRPARG